MLPHEELFAVAKKLNKAADASHVDEIKQPLEALHDAAQQVGRSFSGSWLGYHSRVYYDGLVPAPPGANFSQEWGLQDLSYTSLGSRGDWREYDPEEVKQHIRQLAKNPDLAPAGEAATKANTNFDQAKSEISSILANELEDKPQTPRAPATRIPRLAQP